MILKSKPHAKKHLALSALLRIDLLPNQQCGMQILAHISRVVTFFAHGPAFRIAALNRGIGILGKKNKPAVEWTRKNDLVAGNGHAP